MNPDPFAPAPSPAASPATSLREQALARLQAQPLPTPADPARLLYELQVHQIELEIQNESLLEARQALEATLEQVTNLFDYAPIPYLTLDIVGTVHNANHAAAEFLGVDRATLCRRGLDGFMDPAAAPAFRAFLATTRAAQQRRSHQTSLFVGGRRQWVLIHARRGYEPSSVLVAISDITALKVIEQTTTELADTLGQQLADGSAGLSTLTRLLKHGQERIASALAAAGIVIWEWHVPTNQVLKFRGLCQEDPERNQRCTFTDWQARVHPEDREAFVGALDWGLATDHAFQMDYRLLTEAGQYCWRRAIGEVVERDAGGGAVRAIGIDQDIHELTLAGLQVRKLAAIVEASSDLIATASLASGSEHPMVEYMIPAGRRLLGLPPTGELGNPRIEDFHSPAAFQRIRDEAIPTAQTEGTWQGDNTFLRQDGTELEFSQLIIGIKNPRTRELEALTTICRDVSARKRYERKLLLSQLMLSNAEQLARVGAWTYDVVRAVFLPSAGWQRIMGLERDILTLDQFLSLSHPHDRPMMQAVFGDLLVTGKPIDIERRIINQDTGEILYVQTMARAILDADGQVVEIQGATKDITHRRQLEERIRTQVQQLESVDRRKDAFLATLAHELRNPLAPLSIAAHLLRDSTLPEDQVAWCHKMIERQLGYLVRLVEDLLDVSRITRGKLNLKRKALDLVEIVKEAAETSQPRFEAAHLTLSLQVPAEPLETEADSTRLIQVVSNLLSNAAKFTPPHGEVSVRLERLGDEAVITVRDTGIGIEPEAQTRIFDVFAQTNRTDQAFNTGLGIGLYLCRQLVELHGGTIAVFSAGPGQGSEFVVRLPVCAPPPETVAPVAGCQAAPRNASRRLLVVDDNT